MLSHVPLRCGPNKEAAFMRGSKKENPVPIWERTTLTLMEAVQYTGIGRDKLQTGKTVILFFGLETRDS